MAFGRRENDILDFGKKLEKPHEKTVIKLEKKYILKKLDISNILSISMLY